MRKCHKKKEKKKEPVTEKPVMRNFIYLNEDFLTTFAEQTGKGLPKSREEIETHKNESGTLEISATPSFKAGVTKVAEVAVKSDIKYSTPKSSRETTSKNFYEANYNGIFNDFESYIENEFQEKDTIEIGGYIKGKYKLYFMNFDRIESLFDEGLCEADNSHSDEGKFSRENLKAIKDNLPMLRTRFVHGTYLFGENIVVPIDNEDFLRGKTHQMGFSFGKEATVVGRVKKLLDFDSKNQELLVDKLNEYQDETFLLMEEWGFIKIPESKKLFVIEPIAIFI